MKKIIISFILLCMIPLASGFQFEKTCIDGNTLQIKLAINESGNVTTDIQEIDCPYGCTETTYTGFGSPGCKESDMYLYILAILIIIAALIFIRWFYR